MKIHALILALGAVVGAASVAQAQKAPAPADPLADLQGDFGAVVGEAFERPAPVVAAVSGPGSAARGLGDAFRESLVAPGAVFAAVMKPFADADAPAAPAPAPMPARHRHARLHHHHMTAQG